MKNKKGFTLIELLVVIAIIALLLSILLPGLQKAKKQTKRVICTSNLHQYGIAHQTYASDNNGHIMAAALVANGDPSSSRYPDFWFVKKPTLEGFTDMMNIENINPYINAFTFAPDSSQSTGDRLVATGLAVCPAVSSENVEVRLNGHYQGTSKGGGFAGGGGHVMMNYSYYGRVDQWKSCAFLSASSELTGKLLSSRQVLMSDVLTYWGQSVAYSGKWIYNHGKTGWAWLGVGGFADDDAIPDITGVNRLYGDGGVVWKKDSEFDLMKMDRPIQRNYSGGVIGYNGIVGLPYGFY